VPVWVEEPDVPLEPVARVQVPDEPPELVAPEQVPDEPPEPVGQEQVPDVPPGLVALRARDGPELVPGGLPESDAPRALGGQAQACVLPVGAAESVRESEPQVALPDDSAARHEPLLREAVAECVPQARRAG
jgi:hypothetical protein